LVLPEMIAYAERDLPDGRHATVIPLTFGRARICVAPARADRFYVDMW
jgi:hypothetical protein